MKISKQIKTKGKAQFKGPNVKERKKFAPATKVEKPAKGKGSYDRKNEVIEESKMISDFIDCVMNKNYANAHEHLQNIIQSKIQAKIAAEMKTPIF